MVELGGLETDLLRVECDREHPVWPNHGECNGSPYNVPFCILRDLSVAGEELGAVVVPPYRRKLIHDENPDDRSRSVMNTMGLLIDRIGDS